MAPRVWKARKFIGHPCSAQAGCVPGARPFSAWRDCGAMPLRDDSWAMDAGTKRSAVFRVINHPQPPTGSTCVVPCAGFAVRPCRWFRGHGRTDGMRICSRGLPPWLATPGTSRNAKGQTGRLFRSRTRVRPAKPGKPGMPALPGRLEFTVNPRGQEELVGIRPRHGVTRRVEHRTRPLRSRQARTQPPFRTPRPERGRTASYAGGATTCTSGASTDEP